MATIKFYISVNFETTIKIIDEGSLDELLKKYAFIKVENGTYDVDYLNGCMCPISKYGDKYTFLKVYPDED